jgi:MFS transporter, DHA2 family, multidrug resistance protein
MQSLGVSLIFAPLNVAAYATIAPRLRPAAVGLFNLLRNEGGSFGTSAVQTLIERREQLHTLRLGENLDPYNPAVQNFLATLRGYYQQQTGDPSGSQMMALQSLADLRQQQALALSYFDCFWLFAVVALLLLPLVLLMRRSVAEAGSHIGAE